MKFEITFDLGFHGSIVLVDEAIDIRQEYDHLFVLAVLGLELSGCPSTFVEAPLACFLGLVQGHIGIVHGDN